MIYLIAGVTTWACWAKCTMTCGVHGSHGFTNVFHSYWSKMIEVLCYSDRLLSSRAQNGCANLWQTWFNRPNRKATVTSFAFCKHFQFWRDRNNSWYALNYRIATAGNVSSIRTKKSEITSQDQIDLEKNLKTLHGKIRSNRAEMALYGPTECSRRYLIPTENQPVSLQVSSWPRV